MMSGMDKGVSGIVEAQRLSSVKLNPDSRGKTSEVLPQSAFYCENTPYNALLVSFSP